MSSQSVTSSRIFQHRATQGHDGEITVSKDGNAPTGWMSARSLRGVRNSPNPS